MNKMEMMDVKKPRTKILIKKKKKLQKPYTDTNY